MIARVTTSQMLYGAQRNLQTSLARLVELQEKGASFREIAKPSDDPSGTADALRIRTQISLNDQYGRNIDDGQAWLTTIDSALSNTTLLLRRARDLVVQGANDGALSDVAREAIAVELESIRDELLSTANTGYLGRSVFAGTSDAGRAFAADYSYNGIAGSTVERRIGGDTTVRVDSDGAATFGEGGASVFALLDTIAGELRSGANIGGHLDAIDARETAILAEHALVGARQARIDRAQEVGMERAVTLEGQRAAVEDIDVTRVILELQLQQTNYQSALAVTARALQPTLVDFLR